MKISNFRLIEVTGSTADWKFKALVSVKTDLIFKKTEDKVVYKNCGDFWRFLDTGRHTPNLCVDRLASAFAARQGKDLQHCNIVSEQNDDKK